MLRIFVFLIFPSLALNFNWSSLNLVQSHIAYVFSKQPELKKLCLSEAACPYKSYAQQNLCWGFESGCSNGFGGDNPTVDCNEKNKEIFWKQADFGYLQTKLKELHSLHLCKSTTESSASLRCTRKSTLCEARNLYIDLRSMEDRVVRRDKVELLPGEVGGYCKLDKNALNRETGTKRDLSSWGEQLGPYTELSFDPFKNPSKHCDKVISEPVVFVQLDFGGNMYHHFCDFFNFYLTQMANNSWFGTEDATIIRWSSSPYYGDLFSDSWKVFTNKDVLSLNSLGYNRVCISQATFAFLPRMAFGLFYSTLLVPDCRNSSLFRAFSEHFLHRMGVVDENLIPNSQNYSNRPEFIRVTFLDRGHTTKYNIYRQVINQDELIQAIEEIPYLKVQVVKYSSKFPFKEQLSITHNTDIFIGMHGAGLAHFLFLPSWAVAFELYNCDDISCYRDLARLRGNHYITWEDKSKLKEHDKDKHERYGSNPKFWNFSFDVDEFVRLVKKAKSLVLKHPRFAHLDLLNHTDL